MIVSRFVSINILSVKIELNCNPKINKTVNEIRSFIFGVIFWVNVRWKLNKNATCYFEHLLEATLVWPFTSHLLNNPSKTNKDKLIIDVLLGTPTHRHTSINWPVNTYIYLLCADTEYSLDDLPEEMDDIDGEWGNSMFSKRFDDYDVFLMENILREHLNIGTRKGCRLVRFLCLRAYQLSRVIKCQSHPGSTVVVVFYS